MFSGTLPEPGLNGKIALKGVLVGSNSFEGTLPALSSSPTLTWLLVGQNHLAGTLANTSGLSIFTSTSMVHKGTVPPVLGRLSEKNTSFLFGHGLRGSWPEVAATLEYLSFWANDLEGHLPELHIRSYSMIFVHGNHLSCKLPQLAKVVPTYSMALVGNHFASPKQSFPPWIFATERGSLFVVSNLNAWNLLCMFCGSVVLGVSLCGAWVKLGQRKGRRWHGRLAAAVKVWHQTYKLHAMLSLVSVLLLLIYVPTRIFSCMVILERLRFPALASSGQFQTFLEGMMTLWTFYAFAHLDSSKSPKFPASHQQFKAQQNGAQAGRKSAPRGGAWKDVVTAAFLSEMWFVLCLLVSAPAAIYSAVQAIPGFFGLPEFLQWIVNRAVSLLTTLSTTFGLPKVASQLCQAAAASGIQEVDLLIAAKLLASPIIPCIVTFASHANCLGGWAWFWQPCLDDNSLINLGSGVAFAVHQLEVWKHV